MGREAPCTLRFGERVGEGTAYLDMDELVIRQERRLAVPVSELTVGETVTVEAFEPGDKVKISGTSKGKGFQGTIKRHNFNSGPKSHGSHNKRAPGSIGASATPSRVFKGIKGPGRMGGGRVTQLGLTIVELIPDQNLMLVRGSVPGSKGDTVEVRTDA